MSDIAKFDPNFLVAGKVEREGLVWKNCREEPFCLHGLMRENDAFCRLPNAVAEQANPSVVHCAAHSAGGRVRFVTDSSVVAIHAEFGEIGKMPHFALSGSAGFDLYRTIDGTLRYVKTFIPPFEFENSYESMIEVGDREMREFTINFPLYSEVRELYIGLDEDAKILPGREYTVKTPVVYYGSSITQGGCASKPGSTYESHLSTWLDCDYINLGFSGGARGEQALAEYIAGLSMSLFVLDYDHNAKTLEELETTHEPFFKTVRKAQPNLPILIMVRSEYFPTEDEIKRAEVIRKTYENAKNAGDQNVYLLTGKELMELVRDNGTVDSCHPTDSGFLSMARAMEPVMREILYK